MSGHDPSHDWLEDEAGDAANALQCGHLAVGSILLMNLVGLILSGGIMSAIACAAAPASWWMAQLTEAGALPRATYWLMVVMNIAAALIFIAGAI